MAVEARFYVSAATETNGGGTGIIKMSAVSRGDQNAKWASATPCGNVELTINNLPAFEEMRQWMRDGKDVAVTFEPVFIHKPGDGHDWRQALNGKGEIENGVAYYGEGQCGECGWHAKYHPKHEAYDQAEVDKLGEPYASTLGLTQTAKE